MGFGSLWEESPNCFAPVPSAGSLAVMIRAFQWDLARQIERPEVLHDLLPHYAEWGYQQLYLHLEDAVAYPSLPGVARADAWGWGELEGLVAAAGRVGIAVVPIVNLLGHTQYLIKHPDYRELNELLGPDGRPMAVGQVCPLHPRMGEVAERLLGDVAPLCTAGWVHVGLDESFHLGRHPLSRAEIKEVGLAGHFAGHVRRLHERASARGLRLGLWADMLALLPEAVPLLPAGIAAYDWFYHPFARQPRMELYNFATYDLAPALAARGIGYWACPMNGAFRHEAAPVYGERLANILAWWRRARRTGAEGMLVTSWEPSRLGLETTTLVDASAASLWLEGDEPDDPAALLARGLARMPAEKGGAGRMGAVRAAASARTLLQADQHAFAGYARWEINASWAVVGARGESAAGAKRAANFFARAEARAPRAMLKATLALQAGLARRDVFVREAALGVFRIRRARVARHGERVEAAVKALRAQAEGFEQALRGAERAARVIWAASRPQGRESPWREIFAQDRARLKAWRAWLRAGRFFEASPVCGKWQLRFTVHNFVPALQKVLVEQRGRDGRWQVLHERFAIEFRADAARPRSAVRQGFAALVEVPELRLRIAVRGLGQVRVQGIVLTDGVEERRPVNLTRAARPVVGKVAPKAGFPDLDWANNADELELVFREVEAGLDNDGADGALTKT